MTLDADAAEIEQRLRAGEWLSPPEVAKLFNRHRSTVDYWLKKPPKINGEEYRIRVRRSPGGHRELNPADVLALLEAYRAGPQEPTTPEPQG